MPSLRTRAAYQTHLIEGAQAMTDVAVAAAERASQAADVATKAAARADETAKDMQAGRK